MIIKNILFGVFLTFRIQVELTRRDHRRRHRDQASTSRFADDEQAGDDPSHALEIAELLAAFEILRRVADQTRLGVADEEVAILPEAMTFSRIFQSF